MLRRHPWLRRIGPVAALFAAAANVLVPAFSHAGAAAADGAAAELCSAVRPPGGAPDEAPAPRGVHAAEHCALCAAGADRDPAAPQASGPARFLPDPGAMVAGDAFAAPASPALHTPAHPRAPPVPA